MVGCMGLFILPNLESMLILNRGGFSVGSSCWPQYGKSAFRSEVLQYQRFSRSGAVREDVN